MKVAEIVVTDVDGGVNALALSGAHAGLFQIVSNELQLKPGTALDAETLAQLDVIVNVDDASIGTGIDDSASYSLQVSDTNEPPVLSAIESNSISFIENSMPEAVSSTLIVTEPDSGIIASAKIQLIDYEPGEDAFEFTNQNGITGQFNPLSGLLNLSGLASSVDYQSAIRSVGYNNLSDDPSAVQRLVNIHVSDGVNNSNIVTRAVTVLPVADAPTVNLNNLTNSILENTSTITATDVADISILDADNGPNVLSLSGTDAALFQIQSDRLQLKPGVSLDAESVSQLDVTVTVDDATIGSGVGDSVDYVLLVGDADESPQLSLLETDAVLFLENGDPTNISKTIEVSEPDSSLILSAKISLTQGFDSQVDQLLFSNQNGISGSYNAATGVLKIEGSASTSQYQDAIRSVTYTSAGDDPTTSREFEITVNDGVYDSNSVNRSINLISVNDEEQLLQNTGAEIEINDTLILSNAMLDVSDTDNSSSQLVYTPVGSLDNMQLMVSGVAVNSFTQSDVNLGLVSMDFTGTDPGLHLLQFSVDDGVGTATAFDISINVKDAPVLVTVPVPEPAPEPVPEPVPELGAAILEPILFIPESVISIEPAKDLNTLVSFESLKLGSLSNLANQTEDGVNSASGTGPTETENLIAGQAEESTDDSDAMGLASLSSLRTPDFESVLNRFDVLQVKEILSAPEKVVQTKIKLSDDQHAERQVVSLLSLEPLSINDTTVFKSQDSNVGFINSIEKMQKELARATEKLEGKAVARDTVVGFSLSVTAGFLIWMLRGGALLASMFSISPLWKQLDPLPILSNSADDNFDNAEEDKVESLFRENEKSPTKFS